MKLSRALLTVTLVLSATPLLAQTQQKKEGTTPPKTNTHWQLFGSWRLRSELWNWFPTDKARNDYDFNASLLRFGITRQNRHEETTLEIEQPTLIGLPTISTAPAPQGQLGLGSSYRVASGSQVASLFLKQGYVKFKDVAHSGNAVKLGRFEFSDGVELPASNPSLAALKRDRIGQRLIGPFGFTHVGRSFDGVQITRDKPNLNTTALWAFPTRGVFSLRGMDTLTGVQIAYLARNASHNSPRLSTDSRLFGAYYGDIRPGVLKTDNRPVAVRTADVSTLQIGTIGGHSLGVHSLGSGKFDTLLWGAGQFGKWGTQQHGAYAYALEVGYQPNKALWQPWFRLGYYYASGDGDGGNGRHGTFFPMLPTPRIYARFPFYSETNLEDLFAEVILRPNKRWTLRADIHALGLANSNDLWYAGGGAYDNSAFGYAGRPSGGSKGLGTLYDLSLDCQLEKHLNMTLYLGYAHGGSVVEKSYQGKDATFAYAELTYRF